MQRQFRLQHTRDFERLRREGRVQRNAMLMVSVAPNALAHNRYGFITGKVLGKAVARNRVRRLLREVVRQMHPHLQPGFDFVFIARQPLVGQPFSTVRDKTAQLLRQSGVVVD